jgi:hypothetical protein
LSESWYYYVILLVTSQCVLTHIFFPFSVPLFVTKHVHCGGSHRHFSTVRYNSFCSHEHTGTQCRETLLLLRLMNVRRTETRSTTSNPEVRLTYFPPSLSLCHLLLTYMTLQLSGLTKFILSLSFNIYLFLSTFYEIFLRHLTVRFHSYLFLYSFICFFHNVYVSFHILSVSLHIYLFLSTFICFFRLLSVSFQIYLFLSIFNLFLSTFICFFPNLSVSLHILSVSLHIYPFLSTFCLFLSAFICFFPHLSVSFHVYLFLFTVTRSVSFCVLCSLSRIAKLQKFRHSKLQVSL